MKKETERLPDEKVFIKISSCNNCNGIIRAAVEHEMDTKMKNEFSKEVMKYNLNVSSISLLEYRKDFKQWCDCKKLKQLQ